MKAKVRPGISSTSHLFDAMLLKHVQKLLFTAKKMGHYNGAMITRGGGGESEKFFENQHNFSKSSYYF